VTAAELIDMVRFLTRATDLQDGAILQALNVAMDDVGRNLRAPVVTADILNTAVLAWPVAARSSGILRVEALTMDDAGVEILGVRAIPVLDARSAGTYEPNYSLEEPATMARFIVYNPASSAVPVPVPPPDALNLQSFRITYVQKPTKMAVMTDQPFGGLLDAFHDILAYRAAWLILRDQAMLAEYERRMREARGASNQGIVTVVNPLYRRTVIQSGRG
jgi:hypothetical protein